MIARFLGLLTTCTFLSMSAWAASVEVRTAEVVKAPVRGGLYPHNQAPLATSPFLKLPIGSIKVEGWVRQMLELERNGMVGRLSEISPWLDFSKSSWADKEGAGKFGWEEMPYWLKGYGDLGYVLGDEEIIGETRRWLEAAMGSQREDGWFGPRELLTSLKGKADLWPHMVMLNCLQSYHEYSWDPRVIEVMTRYLKWQNQLPVSAFGEGYWPKLRMGDNIETCYWLYNRKPEPWLLELAAKMHQGMARWNEDVVNWHNVNIAQGFRAGTVFWMQSGRPSDLFSADRNYRKVMTVYGQFPGGGFVGDENSRPGYTDPRGGIETCGIVEFMHSFEMLTRVTGDPIWSDRCEEIAFNSFPVSMAPDQKSLHYITSANQVQLDRENKAPGIQNHGTMFSFSPYEVYRCCQHNVSHGWPYYAEELWLATHDHGLCASIYAASEVTAKVGDGGGTEVKVRADTDYPFEDTVRFQISTPRSVSFPLYLRIPNWCSKPSLRLNGRPLKATVGGLTYVVVTRTWKDGDRLELKLPMEVQVREWPTNRAVSVHYGPLAFSLAIQERWQQYGRQTGSWSEWEVFPGSAWNYGLVLDAKKPAKGLRVKRASGPVANQPWTAKTAPLSIEAKARKIPQWTLDGLGMPGALQQGPIRSSEPVEKVTLIPMGAARLRISAFPMIGDGADARNWQAAPAGITASHCNASDSVEAVVDGVMPSQPLQVDLPRFTWWDRRGSREWIDFTFPKPRKVSAVQIYWFQDTHLGRHCATPADWRLLYRKEDQWLPVLNPSAFGVEPGKLNRTTFEPLECSGLRIEAQLQPDLSAGIFEWMVE